MSQEYLLDCNPIIGSRVWTSRLSDISYYPDIDLFYLITSFLFVTFIAATGIFDYNFLTDVLIIIASYQSKVYQLPDPDQTVRWWNSRERQEPRKHDGHLNITIQVLMSSKWKEPGTEQWQPEEECATTWGLIDGTCFLKKRWNMLFKEEKWNVNNVREKPQGEQMIKNRTLFLRTKQLQATNQSKLVFIFRCIVLDLFKHP